MTHGTGDIVLAVSTASNATDTGFATDPNRSMFGVGNFQHIAYVANIAPLSMDPDERPNHVAVLDVAYLSFLSSSHPNLLQ
jgi:hypothetical protein